MIRLEHFEHRLRRRLCGALFASCLLGPVSGEAQNIADIDRLTGMLSLMQNFYQVMEQVHGMALSPQKAALLQMHEIEEIYKKRGEHRKIIPVYREVLARTEDPVIRTLAFIKLAEALKQTGQQEESIAVLREALNESLERAASSQ